MINIILQIALGLILTFIIYVISLYVIQADKIINKKKQNIEKTRTDIIKGNLSSSEKAETSRNNSWNTTFPHSGNYLALTPSVNRNGGAQFSYSFWLYVGDPPKAIGQTLFLKGDKTPYTYSVRENQLTNNVNQFQAEKMIHDRAILCPSVGFGDNELEFEVRFNTFHNINESFVVKRIENENNLYRNNLLGLFPKTWFFVTITFEDNVAINDFENGILVRFYVNGEFYQMNKYASTLRQNQGDFYIFPNDNAIPDCKISDLSYWNYALSDKEIKDLRKNFKKPSDKSASTTSTKNTEDTKINIASDNYLDIYNI